MLRIILSFFAFLILLHPVQAAQQTAKDMAQSNHTKCLDEALQKRASIIPPKSKRETVQQAVEDCAAKEQLLLRFDKKALTADEQKTAINAHRKATLTKLMKEVTAYEAQIGDTMAFFEVIKESCKPLNKAKLKTYSDAVSKNFNIPMDGEEDHTELASYPLEQYQQEITTKGRDAWCKEAKNSLKEKGVTDVFSE